MARLSAALLRAAGIAGASQPAGLEPPPGAWTFPADEPAADVSAGTPPDRADHALTPMSARFDEANRPKLVVGGSADEGLAEQYRHLAAALHHAQARTGCRSVMITSALPSEGKTLTAANLALTLSHSYQRRVLLIDADLRQPGLQRLFRLPDGDGLSDLLAHPRGGPLPVGQLSPTLWVLAAGGPTVDPMSLLVSSAMSQLLGDAREAFDWVVVDTPPIAILPDANLLAAMLDTTLLVVRAETTPYPMVQRAVDAVGASRILGVVLNRAAKAGLSAGYGYAGAVDRGAAPPVRRWWQRRPRTARVQ